MCTCAHRFRCAIIKCELTGEDLEDGGEVEASSLDQGEELTEEEDE